MKNWEDCQREDLNSIPEMIKHGFEPIFSACDIRAERTMPEYPPFDAVSFSKGNFRAWSIIDRGTRSSAWMTAILVDGYYTGHKGIKSLKELL